MMLENWKHASLRLIQGHISQNQLQWWQSNVVCLKGEIHVAVAIWTMSDTPTINFIVKSIGHVSSIQKIADATMKFCAKTECKSVFGLDTGLRVKKSVLIVVGKCENV